MSSVCDPTQTINNYTSGSYAIDPCNAGTSIGSYDQSSSGADSCLCISGYKSLSTTWTLTSTDIPSFGKEYCKGELNFYVQNGSGVVSFAQGTIAKTLGTITARIYQRNGNLTNVTSTGSGTSATFTWTPAVSGYWTFRGF